MHYDNGEYVDLLSQGEVISDTYTRVCELGKNFNKLPNEVKNSLIGDYIDILRIKIQQAVDMQYELKSLNSSKQEYKTVLALIFYFAVITLYLLREMRRDFDDTIYKTRKTDDIEVEMYQVLIILVRSKRFKLVALFKDILYNQRTPKSLKKALESNGGIPK